MYFSFFGRGKLKRAIIIALLLSTAVLSVHAQSAGTSAVEQGTTGSAAAGDENSVISGGSSVEQAAVQQSAAQAAATSDASQTATDNQQSTRIDESLLTFEYPDSASDTPTVSEPVRVFGFWDLMRMVLVLAVVVGMIYGLYYFMKKSRNPQGEESNFISVLSSQTLPGGKQLHIIDVAGQVYLLGSGDAGVNLITEITDKPSIDELRLQASRKQVQGQNFAQMLSGFFSKGGDDQPENRTGGSSSPDAPDAAQIGFNFVREQRERLKKL